MEFARRIGLVTCQTGSERRIYDRRSAGAGIASPSEEDVMRVRADDERRRMVTKGRSDKTREERLRDLPLASP
jgi:hypothetical protein